MKGRNMASRKDRKSSAAAALGPEQAALRRGVLRYWIAGKVVQNFFLPQTDTEMIVMLLLLLLLPIS
jgi:hypothetical protein